MSYVLSEDSEADLVDIYDYSLSEWGEQQADDYLAGLYACFELLGIKPMIGRPRQEIGDGVRSHLCGSHIVYYMRWKAGVAVVRVLHQARDVDMELFESAQGFTDES